MKQKSFFLFLFLFLFSTFASSATEVKSIPSLEEELQKIKEAGIPTTIEELNLPKIPDEENGAVVYNEVFVLMNSLKEKYKEEWKYFPYAGIVDWEDVPEEEKKKVVDLILHNPEFGKMYQLLEKASQMKCQFLMPDKLTDEPSLLFLNILANLRGCTRMLCAKAKLEAENKDINKSLNTILVALKLGKSLSNEPLLITQLVRLAIDTFVLSQLEEIPDSKEVNISLYQTLIQNMEEERKCKIISESLKREMILFGLPKMRQYQQSVKEKLPDLEQKSKEMSEEEKEYAKNLFGTDDPEKIQKFAEKYWDEEISVYIENMIKIISFAEKPYWEVKKKIEDLNTEIQKIPEKRAVLAKQTCLAVSRAYLQEANLDAYLGTAEIGLANRIYRQQHGKFADSLNQLTPEILSSLPLDPFSGKDYIYKKKDKGFIVYSVGENEKDDGGVPAKKMNWKGDYDIVWEDKGAEIPISAYAPLFSEIGENKISRGDISRKSDNASPEIIKFEQIEIKVITELPEIFLIKTPGTPETFPQVDVEKLYANLYSLKQQGILDIIQVEVFADEGKKCVLDMRKDIPGTTEKEGMLFEIIPEIIKDNKIRCQIDISTTKLVELKKIKNEGKGEEIYPIMSNREQSTCVDITNEKPAIIGGLIDSPEMISPKNTLKTLTMIKATRYVKPKRSIEFRLVKNTPETGFTQTNIPYSDKKIYVADTSEIDKSDIRGVRACLTNQELEQIKIVFTDEGRKKFANLTESLIGKKLAILVDGQLVSVPVIREKITGGIGTIPMEKEIIEKILDISTEPDEN
ncbi:MAG TPA: hypothetical protein PLW95_03780 [bacterium]|nr:hypothetical protein [bacterium]